VEHEVTGLASKARKIAPVGSRPQHALGVDIGGTKIAVGLVDAGGTVSQRVEVATPAQEGADAIIAAVLGAARSAMAGAAVVACGVGTAGVVGEHGEITTATDLLRGWAGTPLSVRLADALHLPVRVLNDVQATGLAEARLGAARGQPSALIVAVGTGIGGALARDGQIVRGAHGIAGSVGHMPAILRQGRICSCGAPDHVEAYASGPSLEGDYRRRTGKALSLRAIARLAAEGDELAGAVVVEGASVLGTAIGGANNLVDASVVVVGGGVATLGELFFAPMREAARREALGASKLVPIVPAGFGADACLVGAGLAGLDAAG
jgi:glucokinase